MRRLPEGYQEWSGTRGGAPPQPGLLKAGDLFPDGRLAVLEADFDIPYLGLAPGTRVFSLSDVRADYLLLELYNELCRQCMEALAGLSRAMAGRRAEGPTTGLKVIGLGAGSTRRAVSGLRREKQFAFPLFADSRRRVFDQLGRPVLPMLYLTTFESGGALRIVDSRRGRVDGLEAYLQGLESRR